MAVKSARQTPVRVAARRVMAWISSADVREVPVTSTECTWKSDADAATRYPTIKVMSTNTPATTFKAFGTYANSARGEKLGRLATEPSRRAGRWTKPFV